MGKRSFGLRRSRSRSYEALESRCLMAADVFITEFLASNDETLLDEDGDSSDWLEIFNAGSTDVNLSGWHLTDDVDELAKWSFPEQMLPAGNLLLVYASGKDRDVAGQPLHANFRLSANGEYLALTNGAQDDSIEIVSQFAPDYPEQLTDVSYGVTQAVTVTSLVEHEDAARILISGETPTNDWTTVGFDDSAWLAGTASVGYQSTVPGFTVQDAKSSSSLLNLSEADAVLNGVGRVSETIAVTPVVNFYDSEGGGGGANFGSDLAFPNDRAGDDNDFAIRATGTITIPTSGSWTFGTNGDDGVRVQIDGQSVINDDTLHAPTDRFGTTQLSAGQHDLELTFFERGGGAEIELFAASGSRTSFSSEFKLVGDVDSGGLAVETSPTGGTTGFGSLIQTNVFDEMYEQASSAYLRIPFAVDDPAAFESLTLRMNYDDGFAAYLNGVEVARRNAPANLAADSVATVDRSASEAIFAEDINISDFLDQLDSGANILAIQGLNVATDGNEFLISAGLAEIDLSQGEYVYFPSPTPRTFNASTGVDDFLINDVTFDQPHGFYEEAFEVSITSATDGTTIRYTLDGSAPTETNGVDYAAPIPISETTTLRARSFKDGTEPSFVETATYLFLEDVLVQSPTGRAPEGFPSSRNINGQELNYGMDPDIVNHAVWGPQLIAALTQVPTMSLVMDIDDLLGSRNGIYTHAHSHGRAWERPASLELMNPDGSEGFQVETGVRIRGGFSRSGSNPKHAFRLFFRDEYGDSKLEFPLFGDEGTDSFDKIDLRTTQNYSWAFQGDQRNAFVRDIFSRDVQGAMGQPYTRGRYYHLYINGQYWGLFQTEERPEANYAASYFGGSADDYDVVKSAGSSGGYQNEATDGNLDAYRRLADLFYQRNGLGDANIEDYYRAQGMNPDGARNPDYERLLDVDSLIDYMIITYHTSDADGPGSKFTRPRVNNYYGIFNREDPDGFKFFEHDSEHSLDTGNAAGANYNMVTPLTTGGSQFRYFNPHWMHEQLARRNSEYQLRFADAVYRHFHHGGVLTEEVAAQFIDSRAAEIDLAMIAESARWGDSKRGTPYTQAHWQSAVDRARDWLDGRTDDVISQLRGQGWYPDQAPPQFTVNGGLQHGGEANGKIGLVSTASLSYSTIVEPGSEWRYLDDGSNQAAAWRELGFDDSNWQAGDAQLGYGDGDEETVVSFGSDSNDKHRTTYFRTSFVLDDLTNVDAGLARVMRDDGAVVYLNGQEIERSNMPSGEIGYRTQAQSVVGGGGESTFWEFQFDVGLLHEGTNELAVEVHQISGTSSDISFDFELLVGSSNAAAGAVYYTLDGTDPRLPGGEIDPTAMIYGEAFTLPQSGSIATRSLINGEWSVQNVASFEVGDQVLGDLNGDGLVDAIDIDTLAQALRNGNQDLVYDLDGSGVVDDADHTYLVESIIGTPAGDIDLDGQVGFSDFLILSTNFGRNGDFGWSQGDLDGNKQVDFSDFLVLSTNFGRQAVAPPPAVVSRDVAPASTDAVFAGHVEEIEVAALAGLAASAEGDELENDS